MQHEAQFLRVEAYNFRDVTRIMGEASRVPEFCPHVPRPEEPTWMLGTAETVRERANEFMAVPCTYTQTNGKKADRKRRNDFRCLVGGVCSWPMETDRYWALARQDEAAWGRERDRLMRWLMSTKAWLQRVFGDRLATMLIILTSRIPTSISSAWAMPDSYTPACAPNTSTASASTRGANVAPDTAPPCRSSWTTTTPKSAPLWDFRGGLPTSRSNGSRIARQPSGCSNWKNA
jgi:hypothetical protein